MWRMLLDGVEALGAKARGANLSQSRSRVSAEPVQLARYRSPQRQMYLSQAWQERLRSEQSPQLGLRLRQSPEWLERVRLAVYQSRVRLMCHLQVYRARVQSVRLASVQPRTPRLPEIQLLGRLEQSLLQVQRTLVYLAYQVIQKLAVYRQQALQTSRLAVYRALGRSALSLLLFPLLLVLLVLLALAQLPLLLFGDS